jgi:hypothetical protein
VHDFLSSRDFSCTLSHRYLNRTLGNDGFNNLQLGFDGSLDRTVCDSFLDWKLSKWGLRSMLVRQNSLASL